ncbi:hypothetical protein BDZ89DRAFT_182012 [Hymenopellis radicata]|nr:hypothetical protein BDZ89DRAFT_182012 [Hymenopellis radicata]
MRVQFFLGLPPTTSSKDHQPQLERMPCPRHVHVGFLRSQVQGRSSISFFFPSQTSPFGGFDLAGESNIVTLCN